MGFLPICDPLRFFFKNLALLLLYPYGTLTSLQIQIKKDPFKLTIGPKLLVSKKVSNY